MAENGFHSDEHESDPLIVLEDDGQIDIRSAVMLQGWNAAEQGLFPSMNPYREASYGFDLWNSGFDAYADDMEE